MKIIQSRIFDRQHDLPWIKGLGSIILTSLMLQGCASTSTTTNKDAQYTGHPSRIFVVYSLDPLDAVFSTDFENLFRKRMEACNGAVAFHRTEASEANNALALTPTPGVADAQKRLSGEIAEFSPDAILSMHVVHRYLINNMLNGVTINLKLWDVPTKKFVWAGVSQLSFAPASTDETRAGSLFGDLSPRLSTAGLIPTCPAVNQVPPKT
jgi:hypothetical protein